MKARFDPVAAAPELMKAWIGAALPIAASLEPAHAELVEIRASQINGCASCIHMHSQFARENGESEQRIYLLPAWREAPCYTRRERAALEWTDALTLLSDASARERAYEALRPHFTGEEMVKLTLTIVVINGWNRIAMGCGGFADPAAARAVATAVAGP